MTPRAEQYAAILAIAELVEINALDPDNELPYYLAQALNLNVADLLADTQLTGLMANMRTSGADIDHIARQILDYIS